MELNKLEIVTDATCHLSPVPILQFVGIAERGLCNGYTVSGKL